MAYWPRRCRITGGEVWVNGRDILKERFARPCGALRGAPRFGHMSRQSARGRLQPREKKSWTSHRGRDSIRNNVHQRPKAEGTRGRSVPQVGLPRTRTIGNGILTRCRWGVAALHDGAGAVSAADCGGLMNRPQRWMDDRRLTSWRPSREAMCGGPDCGSRFISPRPRGCGAGQRSHHGPAQGAMVEYGTAGSDHQRPKEELLRGAGFQVSVDPSREKTTDRTPLSCAWRKT